MVIEVDDKTALMDRTAFGALLEYSCSIPTETTVGKRWRRAECECTKRFKLPDGRIGYLRDYGTCEEHDTWFMGEYEEKNPPDPEHVSIHWREILIVE